MMKVMLYKESIATAALLMLLSLSAIASISTLVDAAAIKDPTVYVTGSGSVELTWKSGKSQTYNSSAYANFGGLDTIAITPSRGWHIDVVLFDGVMQEIVDEDGFSLFYVQVKKMISVTFLENGGVDDVDVGSGVGTHPDPDVSIYFENVIAAGDAFAWTIGLWHPNLLGDSWDVYLSANVSFEGYIDVMLVLDIDDLGGSDPNLLTLWKTQIVLGDVNLDGKVDGTDESIVANANPSEPGDPNYDPKLDLNDNNRIDDEDVWIVSHNIGEESVWEPLESWRFIGNDFVYVYGRTSSLSVFGVHRA